MTEIPMPGDYGAQPEPAPREKGCCARCCECWMWILLAVIIIFAVWFILAMMTGLWFFGFIFG